LAGLNSFVYLARRQAGSRLLSWFHLNKKQVRASVMGHNLSFR
jgi:hypothetical protein